MSKFILEAGMPGEIDALLDKTITMADYNHNQEVTILRNEVLAIFDNTLLLGVYGHHTNVEAAVPAANCAAFYDNSIKLA